MKKVISLVSAVVLASFVFTGCGDKIGCIKGKGAIVERTLEISDFSGIGIAGSFDVVVSQGDQQEVVVKGHQNIVDLLETHVSSNFWEIKFKDRECIKDYELTIYITVPNLDAVKLSGSGNVDINSFVEQNTLDLTISGSGNITSNQSIEGLSRTNIEITGSGNVSLKGVSDKLDVTITGSGKFKGYDFESQDCTIEISGSGDCEVNASKSLDVKTTGSGSVYYYGIPAVSVQITGSGTVNQR